MCLFCPFFLGCVSHKSYKSLKNNPKSTSRKVLTLNKFAKKEEEAEYPLFFFYQTNKVISLSKGWTLKSRSGVCRWKKWKHQLLVCDAAPLLLLTLLLLCSSCELRCASTRTSPGCLLVLLQHLSCSCIGSACCCFWDRETERQRQQFRFKFRFRLRAI